jgi:hypothetical protein
MTTLINELRAGVKIATALNYLEFPVTILNKSYFLELNPGDKVEYKLTPYGDEQLLEVLVCGTWVFADKSEFKLKSYNYVQE